ncbi:hypothetical protein Tco_0266121 [Tanacetum coccineum]
MEWLPRCDELLRSTNTQRWEDAMVLYCHRSVIEDCLCVANWIRMELTMNSPAPFRVEEVKWIWNTCLWPMISTISVGNLGTFGEEMGQDYDSTTIYLKNCQTKRGDRSQTSSDGVIGYKSIERDRLVVIEIMVAMDISLCSYFSDNEDDGLAVPVFSPGDDPIACLNKAMAFLTAIASSREDKGKIILVLPIRAMLLVQGEILQVDRQELLNATTAKEKAMLAEAQEVGQILDEEQLAFLADPGILAGQAQTIIPHNAAFQTKDLDIYDSDCDDLSTAQAVLMANISNYGSDVISEEKANKEQNNESITAKLERYKERVKTFEQRLNIYLSSHEKMIDSQMDDMIREKLALKEQIDSLEQNLSKQIKEKESLFKTFLVFKNESKEKENKYMENEIDLEKKIKELDNIICKVGQYAQIVNMLTKSQAFYDNTHKQALGYQNPFYLKKAQRIKPTLYDGVVLSNTHVAMPVIDDEETLILEEESRSKMFEKAKDPKVIAKKISHKPIDYEKLNSLTDDFKKLFSPQQELSAEQAFWFHILNPSIESFYTPPVIVEVPSELPKVSLVNASLKKLKFHLTQFDSVVKKRTTPNALEEEVQTVFDQMDAAVQQSLVDKQCLEIAKKEILLENDRLLQKIMSQYVLLTVINSMSWNNDYVNMEMQTCDSCEKCLNLDAELSKSKQAYNNLLKNYSQLKKHCISLEVSMQLKQEVFQNDESCVNHNGVEIQEYFEINDLKARLQDKDTTICKLKDTIRSLSKNTKEENVNHDKCELEPINEELENSVAKLLSENERLCNEINHVKQFEHEHVVMNPTPSWNEASPSPSLGRFKNLLDQGFHSQSVGSSNTYNISKSSTAVLFDDDTGGFH